MYFSYNQQIWDCNTSAPSEAMFIIFFTLFLFIMCKLAQSYLTLSVYSKTAELLDLFLLVL